MKPDNLIVFCLRCRGHFKSNQTHQLKVIVEESMPPANLYLCKECYNNIPEAGELPIVPNNIEILKLRAIHSEEQLKERLPEIEQVERELDNAILQALMYLQPFGVTKEALEELIDKIITKSL